MLVFIGYLGPAVGRSWFATAVQKAYVVRSVSRFRSIGFPDFSYDTFAPAGRATRLTHDNTDGHRVNTYSITDHSTDLRAAVGVAAVTSLHSHSTSTKSSTGWSARSTSRSSSSEKLSSQVTYRSCERSGDR